MSALERKNERERVDTLLVLLVLALLPGLVDELPAHELSLLFLRTSRIEETG